MKSAEGASFDVSIITICFNAAGFLEATIRSVLDQKIKSLQYIIIDGGSTDGTVDIIKKYEKYISEWVSEKDRGISHAFNKGLERARGPVIGILNAGDLYLPGAIERSVNALSGSEAGFSFGSCIFTEHGRPVYRLRAEENFEKRISWRMPAVNHPTVFVKKEVYDAFGGFLEKWPVAMDYDLLLRFHRNGVLSLRLEDDIASMDISGVSQRRYLESMKEMRDISISGGYSQMAAYTFYLYNVLKYRIRVMLQQAGMNRIVSIVRKLRDRNFSKPNEG